MKLLSLFSGIGAFEKALDRVNVPYELVNFCEFDKFASKSYCTIHGVSNELNLGDITKVDLIKLYEGQADLITYGFPCQDISSAGKQEGFKKDGKLTRSGLFFYAATIIGRIKPKIAIAENVKALTSKKFKKEFKSVLDTLHGLGYNNYYQVLNAKDYGIPQNRERVFIVSLRKDIDNGKFEFPKPFHLELRLKDMLEKEVDEKYYLSEQAIAGFNKHAERHNKKGDGYGWKPKDGSGVANTIQTIQLRSNCNFIYESPTRIRKLTPLECWRLMGFGDEDFYKAQSTGISNTQLYKQAGNSIVVDVLEKIYCCLFNQIVGLL